MTNIEYLLNTVSQCIQLDKICLLCWIQFQRPGTRQRHIMVQHACTLARSRQADYDTGNRMMREKS